MLKPLHSLVASTHSRAGFGLLGLVLALASVAGVMAQALGPAGPSPATGAASVIAQGVYNVTDADYVWQVSTYTAETGTEPLTIAAPTFVIARTTPLLVTDENSGNQMRVANGEATYLHPGQNVRLETFGPPDDFTFVELTPENAASAGADPLVGQAFRPLAGSRDLDLVRDVLDEGEQSVLPEGAGRTLVFGLTGQVSATASDGVEMPIAAGDIAEFEGEITFTGVTDGSEFVAAYIGAVIGFGDEDVAAQDATPATDAPASPAVSPDATPEPALVPTEIPTQVPTVEPTAEPTAVPTEEPTAVPTDEPTATSTSVPTEAPTQVPTEEPTVVPTDVPTDLPTVESTAVPTDAATVESSPVPTNDPTIAPSPEPTVATTQDPAMAPTEAPAGAATPQPTENAVVAALSGDDAPAFELEVIEGDPGTDTDSDGLTEMQEAFYETNPESNDSDADGLSDFDELAEFGTDPLLADTDDDGMLDANEIFVYQTDPLNLDTDGDILYDGGELVYNTDPLNPDTDGDGLTDGEEVYFAKTDPAEADTDGDGINDFDEVVNGTDPLSPTGSTRSPGPTGRRDSDGDGLTNAQESRYGTDPEDGDSDGDSVNDSNEVSAGTNPLDINSWPR